MLRQIARWTLLLLVMSSLQPVWAQLVMIDPKPNDVSPIQKIVVTVSGKAGAEAKLFINGDSVRTDTVRLDGLLDFIGVPVPQGPVNVRVEAAGAGRRVFTAERDIHVLGPPHRFVSVDQSLELPADGATVGTFKFEIQDEWGYRLTNIKQVTLNLSHGTMVSEDADSTRSGFQLPVREGLFEIALQAHDQPLSGAYVEMAARSHVERLPFRFTSPVIPFILVGGVDAAVATRGEGEELDDQPLMGILNRYNTALTDRASAGGRVAFYTKGSLRPGLNLTASLDTDRGYMDQMFVDVDPYEPYPLFGDASTIVYDAQSRSKLYAKLESGESFAMFGDYNTNLIQNEFTAYNRTFNGVLSDLNRGNHNLLMFSTITNREMLQEDIRGEGISGYYYLEEKNITRFSEKVRIITRDRHKSEVIVNSTELSRFMDYDINYIDGTLMFKQPVPGVDGAGNPVFIVISYEFEGESAQSVIGGLEYSTTFKNGAAAGATFITEERGADMYYLYGMNSRIPISRYAALNFEIAQSRDPDADSDDIKTGSAYKVEIQSSPIEDLSLETYFRNVEDDFVNASQTGSEYELGSRKYGISGAYRSVRLGRFNSELYREEGKMGTGSDLTSQVFNLNLTRELAMDRSLRVGYENAWRERQIGLTDSSERDLSHILKAQYDILLLGKIKTSFEHEQNLDAGDRSKPTTSSVGISYPITEYLDVFWKYRFIQGADVKRQSVLGFNSRIKDNTEIEAKYEIGGITGEDRNRATIGLNNRWEVREDLVLNLAIENVATADSFEIPTPSHQSMSLSAEYLPEFPLKATAKYEIRDDQQSLQRVIGIGGDIRIFHGFGALVKLDHFENRFKGEGAGSITRDNYQAGLAYRPEEHDRLNALTKLAYVSDRNTHITPSERQDRLILSSHTYYQIKPMVGIGTRLATRMVLDEEGDLFSDNTQTYLASVRGEYGFNLDWSAIIDARVIHLQPLKETSIGLAAEVDYTFMKNMQAGVGYIFKNLNDPDFDYLEYAYNNVYLTLHMKFSEDIFNWR